MTKRLFTVFSILLFSQLLFTQTPRERSVEVSAITQLSPPALHFSWTADNTATEYKVYKKALNSTDWGMPIAVLPGTDTTFSDYDIEVGEGFEYAFFKKAYELVTDTICIPAGTEVKLTLNDMYGIGLCCNFGFGYYRVEACDDLVAQGDNFGFNEEVIFEVCDNGNTCTDVIITIAPDMFPNSTSWVLTDHQTGQELANSGGVGSFISERPKFGFIYAGIHVPAIEKRGAILLLIDDEYAVPLASEIDRLRIDLIKDGWQVRIRYANKNDEVGYIKSIIQEVYNTNVDLKALFILGHIPVPYSGDIYPDTHSENHQGAWAADTYYGELNGVWTDNTADITTAFFQRNHNVPGDGKFDQDSIPTGEMELQVGRVDFFNMPAFGPDETTLTRRYLDKNHLYRNGFIRPARRGLIDDNFGQAFAGPAASGWRNFSAMFGAEKVVEADYFSTMSNQSYLWSYGCGSGSHISANGIGSTSDFANDSLLTVFTMLFGSQFGDWDNENNFLKAPLASGLTLTNVWAGNPAWHFHDMALGYNIGHSVQRTQNTVLRGDWPGPQLVHTALMGDPSLRMHMIKAPAELDIQLDTAINLQWAASDEENILGYYVYRADSLNGSFERLTPEIIQQTEFEDTPPRSGHFFYMVKAVKLETSASGSYYNLSPGIIAASDFVLDSKTVGISDGLEIWPNPGFGEFVILLEKASNTGFTLEVLDLTGRVVYQKASRTTGIRVNLQHLGKGIYFFRVRSEKKTAIRKVIKQ